MPHIRPASLTAALLIILAIAGFALFTVSGPGRGLLIFDWDWTARLPEFLAEVYDGTVVQLFALMISGGMALEWLIPARVEPLSNAPLNIVFGAMMLFFAAALVPIQAIIVRSSIDRIGWSGLFDLGFDPGTSLVLAVCAMLVSALALDFFFYWFHRLQHSGLLWPQHLLHHSDTALNVTTTQRAHFLEHFLIPIFMTLPLALLFRLPAVDLIWIAAIPAAWAYFVHMNIRVNFGPLWWLLTSPQYHRIHHSIEPKHFDRNFALWFPIWDLLFGTAYRPRAGEYPATGVSGVDVTTLSQAAALPFAGWYRMAADGLRRLRQSS
jgi:sterol desaturase/sphingolipid hydroxylase (fatty acid hydroxylase superfamily)